MERYFEKALADFTFEAASGGAIRHLVDQGYTAKQIVGKLDYPTPYEKVQKAVLRYLISTGYVLEEEPVRGSVVEQAVYVTDQDRFGRKSYRKVIQKEKKTELVHWKEDRFSFVSGNIVADILNTKCQENGEEHSYISCDFGLLAKRDEYEYEQTLAVLTERQREYVDGVFCERKRFYHRLDSRMKEIVLRLYENGRYSGVAYFTESEDKIWFESK